MWKALGYTLTTFDGFSLRFPSKPVAFPGIAKLVPKLSFAGHGRIQCLSFLSLKTNCGGQKSGFNEISQDTQLFFLSLSFFLFLSVRRKFPITEFIPSFFVLISLYQSLGTLNNLFREKIYKNLNSATWIYTALNFSPVISSSSAILISWILNPSVD